MLSRSNFFHYKKRKNLGINKRKHVWNKHVELLMGKYYATNFGKLPCFVCNQTMLDPFNFECGHIISVAKGGTYDINNLHAVCSLCNKCMGTENLFAYKFKLSKKMDYCNEFNQIQKSILEYYNYLYTKLSINVYQTYFYDIARVIFNSMYTIKKFDNYQRESIAKCDCNYEFTFCTENDFLPLTCKNTAQNIIHIIHDHIYCLIYNTKFINATIATPGFIQWTCSKQYLLTI